MATKNCFIDKARPCDLTCKAAFPVDDAVDPVDCYFIWLASHVGEGAFDFRRMMEMRLGPDTDGPDTHGGPPSKPGLGPKGGVSPN
ncbi:MAG: hypothetical protein R3F49_20400 [Planctomycetota bacterium]